jgi:hypothetical protein
MIENTPIDAVFLTVEYPGCPATSIAGRTSLNTFPGWAWTHGVWNAERYEAIQMMWASARPELFAQYGTQYALHLPSRSSVNWTVDPADTRWLQVFVEKDVEVWEVVDPLLAQESEDPDAV